MFRFLSVPSSSPPCTLVDHITRRPGSAFRHRSRSLSPPNAIRQSDIPARFPGRWTPLLLASGLCGADLGPLSRRPLKARLRTAKPTSARTPSATGGISSKTYGDKIEVDQTLELKNEISIIRLVARSANAAPRRGRACDHGSVRAHGAQEPFSDNSRSNSCLPRRREGPDGFCSACRDRQRATHSCPSVSSTPADQCRIEGRGGLVGLPRSSSEGPSVSACYRHGGGNRRRAYKAR